MTVGERIKRERKKAGLTQSDLAKLLHTSNVVISQWENGDRYPKQESLLKLAKAMKTHLRNLVDDSWLEEIDQTHAEEIKQLTETIHQSQIVEHYLNSLGFTLRIVGESDYSLSKNDDTAVFTEEEFLELQKTAKDVIEGQFYKKVIEQAKNK